MQSKSVTAPFAVGHMSTEQRMRPLAGDEQKSFVRKAIPTAPTDQVKPHRGVPTRMLSQQIQLILQTCEKMLQPGQGIPIKIDGAERVLFRTRSGNAVGLQTNEEYIHKSKNGYFIGNEKGRDTMKVDNRYLTTMKDPNYHGASLLLHDVISAIGASGNGFHPPAF